MKEITVGRRESGIRLDQFLERLLPSAGKSFLYKMLRKKNIVLNGKKAQGNERLQEHDVICIFFSDDTYAKFSRRAKAAQKTQAMPLPRIRVIYEDGDILIADKPAGLLTQKASAKDVCLNDWLREYAAKDSADKNPVHPPHDAGGDAESGGPGTERRTLAYEPSVMNRLDRNTSGMVLCAKSYQGARALFAVLKDRSLHKYYLTLVTGHISRKEVLSGYLTKDSATNTVTILKHTSETSEGYIRTEYEPLLYLYRHDMTLLKVCLITGKPHQIRAHLASVSHPVAGDPKYGNPRFNETLRKRYDIRRQLLHAYEVVFPEKDKNEAMRMMSFAGKAFRCPLPRDFMRILGEYQGEQSWQHGIPED